MCYNTRKWHPVYVIKRAYSAFKNSKKEVDLVSSFLCSSLFVFFTGVLWSLCCWGTRKQYFWGRFYRPSMISSRSKLTKQHFVAELCLHFPAHFTENLCFISPLELGPVHLIRRSNTKLSLFILQCKHGAAFSVTQVGFDQFVCCRRTFDIPKCSLILVLGPSPVSVTVQPHLLSLTNYRQGHHLKSHCEETTQIVVIFVNVSSLYVQSWHYHSPCPAALS